MLLCQLLKLFSDFKSLPAPNVWLTLRQLFFLIIPDLPQLVDKIPPKSMRRKAGLMRKKSLRLLNYWTMSTEN